MKKFRAISLLLSIVLIVSIAITGCGEKELTKVTVAEVTHSVFYAPQYVALTEGFFEEEGLEVEFLNTKGADKTMTALLSGKYI